MSSNLKTALIGLAVIAVALVVLLFVIRGRNTTSQDPQLRTTGERLAPRLQQARGKWASAPSLLKRYEGFASKEQIILEGSKQLIPANQFVQVQLIPPAGTAAAVVLSSRTGVPVNVDPASLLLTTATKQPRYATSQQGGTNYQVYLMPLQIPQSLQRDNVKGIIEVVEG